MDNFLHAGIVVAIALLVWLILHFLIRMVVKRTEKGTWHQRSLGWIRPVFRNLDPMIRALDNQRRVQRSRTIGTLLNSLLTMIVVVIAAFYVLLAFKVDIAPLLASVGVVGIAIGFGSQQLIRDFLAGIFLTLEDQFGIGDVIQTGEVIGQVEYVGLRITRVLGEDGTLWYLRNGEILRLGNRSKGNYVPPQEPGTVQEGTLQEVPAQDAPAQDAPAQDAPAQEATLPAAPAGPPSATTVMPGTAAGTPPAASTPAHRRQRH